MTTPNEILALQALRDTQTACDVSQCPWCGSWGPSYAESGQPVAYCHHEYSLTPWQSLWPDAVPREAPKPFAWAHCDPARYDVIHNRVKEVLQGARLDTAEHYTIALYREQG